MVTELSNLLNFFTIIGNFFTGNVAAIGGTFYWENSLYKNLPAGLTNNNFTKNIAAYGETWASQAVSMNDTTPRVHVTKFGTPIPDIRVELVDQFSSPVANSTQTIALSLVHKNCFSQTGYLTGTLAGTVMRGYTSFSGVVAECAPQGAMTIGFSAVFNDTQRTIRGTQVPDRTAWAYSNLTFRACVPGEYLKQGNCFSCPVGKVNVVGQKLHDYDNYSIPEIPTDLVPTTCISAPVNADATLTSGDQIYAMPGFWRISPQALTLLACPHSQLCIGGYGTGNELCYTGSVGPLCTSCATGYYTDTTTGHCASCTGNSSVLLMIMTPLVLFVVAAGFALRKRIMEFVTAAQEWLHRMHEVMMEAVQDTSQSKGFASRLLGVDLGAKIKIMVAVCQVSCHSPFNTPFSNTFNLLIVYCYRSYRHSLSTFESFIQVPSSI